MTNTNDIVAIEIEELSRVNGGVKWGAAFDRAIEWGCRGGTLGTIGGAGVGSIVPGVGTMSGAGVGGLAGTVGGFAAGLGKGIYDTWNQ